MKNETILTFLIIVLTMFILTACGSSGGKTPAEPISTTWFLDSDEDGYGDPDYAGEAETQPSGWVANDDDWDDTDDTIYPGAPELCDGKNNDQDEETDEGCSTWYLDFDLDGYGDIGNTTENYNQPLGYVSNNTDWDDTDDTIYPDAPELCDGKDNNGINGTDEGCLTWYLDFDLDEYGDIYNTTEAITQPSGYVSSNTDWDDTDGTIYPDAPELCDGKDNDQNGLIDDGFGGSCQYTITLYPTDDTFARNTSIGTNYGGSGIYTGNRDDGWVVGIVQFGFVKFDISEIPANATIIEATLQMTPYASTPVVGTDVFIYQVSGNDWDEYNLNYSNMPTGEVQSVSKYVEKEKWAMETVEWNLTSFVDSWIGGADNYGIKIRTPNHEYLGTFYSKESYGGPYGPTLIVTLTIP